jgi:rubrerythrin
MTTAPEQGPPAPTDSIDNVGEFLVHALELEHESAAHYEQLADSMEVHHNEAVATMFRRLAQLSDEHANQVGEHARGMALPRIAPWEFKWNCPGGPEGGDCLHGEISYQMSAVQALELALHNETRGHDFYARTASRSRDAEVRALAAEMAAEEAEHVELLRKLLAEERRRGEENPENLDPPHMPA